MSNTNGESGLLNLQIQVLRWISANHNLNNS